MSYIKETELRIDEHQADNRLNRNGGPTDAPTGTKNGTKRDFTSKAFRAASGISEEIYDKRRFQKLGNSCSRWEERFFFEINFRSNLLPQIVFFGGKISISSTYPTQAPHPKRVQRMHEKPQIDFHEKQSKTNPDPKGIQRMHEQPQK